MSVLAVLALVITSVVVTCIELSYRNQRHPFGDKRLKAILWWVAIATVDAAVGIAVFFGVASVKLASDTSLKTANGVWLGIIIGVLGPLALRSPVKSSSIANKQATVGITYVYDLVRLNALFALDERFIRLKRRDVTARRMRWQSQGLSVDEIVIELNRHIDDHEHMMPDRREQIRESIRNVLTVPDEDVQINGLIKLMKAERFNSLIDEFDERVVSTEQAGAPQELPISEAIVLNALKRR